MAMPFDTPIICPVLIGRSELVAALHRRIDAALNGQGQVLLVAGEAGVGKSRLVTEAKAYAADRSILTLQGTCFPQDRAWPYALVLDVLRGRFAGQTSTAIAAVVEPFTYELFRLLPDLVPAPNLPRLTVHDPAQEQQRLFAAFVHCLVSVPAAQPLLLIVEDLHWSDEGSLEALLYLVRRATAQPVLLVGTYRSDEVSSPLQHWLEQLGRARLAEQLALPPLTRDEVGVMLRAIFAQHRPVRAEFLNAIYTLTEGNPFYIEEVLKALVAAGAIFLADGVWDRKAMHELGMPHSLFAAVQLRTTQLSADARRILALAAVIGRRFDFTLLMQLAQIDERTLLQHIKELIAAQLVVEESEEDFAFRHALTRQAVYTGLLARERAEMHSVIAETAERRYADSPDSHTAELAYHFCCAGIWDRALTYAQQAGSRAQQLGTPYAAIEQFTRALDAASHLSAPPDPQVYLARGRAFETLGDFERAREDYELGLRLARAVDNGMAEWQSLINLGQLWAGRDYEQTGVWFQHALDCAARLDDPRLHAHSFNRLGNWLLNIGRSAEGLQAHQEALALFQSQQDIQGRAETLDLLGMANGIYGDEVACATYYGQAIDLFRVLGDLQGLSSSLAARALDAGPGLSETVYSALASREACERDAAEALQVARQIDWLAGQAFAEWCAGVVLAAFGDLGAGLTHARLALRIASEIEHQQWEAGAQSALGQIYVQMRAPERAIQHLEAGLPLARALKSSWWIGNITAYLALAYLLKHDLAQAEATLAEAMPLDRLWAHPPRNLPERRMAWIHGELALAQDAPEQALRIADRLLATLPGAKREQPIPVLLKLKGEALLALHRPDEAMQTLIEARHGAEERSERTLLWPMLRTLGEAYQRLGQRKQAQRMFTASRDVIASLAATIGEPELREQFLRAAHASLPRLRPPTPGHVEARRFGGLTARERNVARQIAQGKSNQEIADALVVSKRTIETHIGSILAKLSVATRAQIAVWASEQGLLDASD